MSFAELDGVELLFTDEGGGQAPMLFVHGFACDSHDWSWQLAHFAARFRVIALNLRGHGRSSAPARYFGQAPVSRYRWMPSRHAYPPRPP